MEAAMTTNATELATKDPPLCKICGDRALQKYVGVLVCPPCKTFFKRNVEAKRTEMPCRFDGHCQIDKLNRHTCSSCRLKKCFDCGMQSELLRGALTKQRPTSSTKKTNAPVRATDKQLPTLNLLRADQSTLSVEQWTLLSNLLHCYDEYGGMWLTNRFVREQNALPPKSRYKSAQVDDISTALVGRGQLLFEKNGDFLGLGAHDRSLLLHGKTKFVGGLGACFIFYTLGFYDMPETCHALAFLYGPERVVSSKRVGAQTDRDSVFMKLVMAIIVFSTLDLTVYDNSAPVNFEDAHAISRVQDTYTELAWRYLTYKYDHVTAVRCFLRAVRWIFAITDVHAGGGASEGYDGMVDRVTKQAEETLSIST